jgi:hypothetical protein
VTAHDRKTCQICNRQIAIHRGRMVQHGYQVPWGTQGNHSRTSSCMGYGYPPYEVSRDRIKDVIEIYKDWYRRNKEALAELMAAPPAEIVETRKIGWNERTIVAQRPSSFDPKYQPGAYRSGSYELLFHNKRSRIEQSISLIAIEIGELEHRWNAWKAPEVAA